MVVGQDSMKRVYGVRLVTYTILMVQLRQITRTVSPDRSYTPAALPATSVNPVTPPATISAARTAPNHRQSSFDHLYSLQPQSQHAGS